MTDQNLKGLQTRAFEALDEDEKFRATAGAIYDYAHAKGRIEGQKEGFKEGRTLTSSVWWAGIVLVSMMTGAIVGAGSVWGTASLMVEECRSEGEQ